MKVKERRYIQCRFCGYHIVAWYTMKSGKKRSGYQKLRQHIASEHPNEFEKIKMALFEEEQEKIEAFTKGE